MDCRCCGRAVVSTDAYPIHTKCIVKHWDTHRWGRNASRCREYGAPILGKCEASREHVRCGREARNDVRVNHGADVEHLTLCNACTVRITRDASGRGIDWEVTGPAIFDMGGIR